MSALVERGAHSADADGAEGDVAATAGVSAKPAPPQPSANEELVVEDLDEDEEGVEEDVERPNCPGGFVLCTDRTCITRSRLCDGVEDCAGGWDELVSTCRNHMVAHIPGLLYLLLTMLSFASLHKSYILSCSSFLRVFVFYISFLTLITV